MPEDAAVSPGPAWIPLDRAALEAATNRPIAVHGAEILFGHRFRLDVANYTARLGQNKEEHFALYCDDSYPFLVRLFALLHAGKQVWIPGNNRPRTAENLLQQGCQLSGTWYGRKATLIINAGDASILEPLDLIERRLHIFTSGSTGKPKDIAKSLVQLQREVEVLEHQWGTLLGRSTAVATVSHQHIYGLLFKILWPLVAGRCFHSKIYSNPEAMLKSLNGTPAYWIASPAQLKRLDESSSWHDFSCLTVIFSSGGALPTGVAKRIERHTGIPVIEIYGSSETGGIGWRHTASETHWTPFPGIRLAKLAGRCRLASPFLPGSEPCYPDDTIELHGDGRFTLGGRLDRIVKIEEKRLSLDAMEAELNRSIRVAQSHCLLLVGRRDRIVAVVIPTEEGRVLLKQRQRNDLIRELRSHLAKQFDTVVLPRKWLFTNTLPVTAEGKIDVEMLRQLMQLDPLRFPQLLYCGFKNKHTVELELRVRSDLLYFEGHFPGQPILPGVVQLAWVERYGEIFFAIEQPFLRLELIKFKKIIGPGALLKMTLGWTATNGRLYFELYSEIDSHGSGRMVYGARE
ncbi:MAG: AMP-binding protein [Gammaproteobacteria bacterium]